MYPQYWPDWIELSKRLYTSPSFVPLTATIEINASEKILVLRRGFN
jgi:hypothetical protein